MEENRNHKGWFARNWMWAVPSGGCLLVIVLFVVFAGSIFVGVTSLIKESTPYEEALTAAQSNELVIEAIGEPIETHGMMRGTININGDDGSADFNIPITGPKGDAKLMVVARKASGTWTYQVLEVVLNANGDVIPLTINQEQLE